MRPEEFDFEISRVVTAIRQHGCNSVLLQFPEGLKRKGREVATEIASQVPKCKIVVSGEPCYGACDIPQTDADLIVHFGHLPIPSIETEKSVLYIQTRSSADPLPAVELALSNLPEKVGVVTTTQHIHTLSNVIEFLEKNGIKVHVGKGDGRTFTAGQVLGCNTSSARAVADEVDVFLYVGTGNFHPLAITIATGKGVVIADPVTGEVRRIEELKNKVLKQRFGIIELAKNAKRFGIVLSTKIGQRRERATFDIKETLEGYGKEAVIVEMNSVTPQKLDAFGLDCWVSTVCPRLAVDDYALFSKPLISPVELEIAFGIRPWEEYALDEIFPF